MSSNSYRGSREDDDYRSHENNNNGDDDTGDHNNNNNQNEGNTTTNSIEEEYQDCKMRFDKAEKAFSIANDDYERTLQVRLEKQEALQNAKRDMDDAYQRWTNRGSTATASTPTSDTRHYDDRHYDHRGGDDHHRDYRDDNRKRKYDGYHDEGGDYRRGGGGDRRGSSHSYGGGGGGGGGYSRNGGGSGSSRHNNHYQDLDRSSSGGGGHYRDYPSQSSTQGTTATASDEGSGGKTDPSIFIPFVHSNITRERIQDAIEGHGFGRVRQIDLVPLPPRPGKPPVNRAYVHLTWASQAEEKRQEYLRVQPGGHVPVVYQDPWFWKTMPNKPPAAQRAAAAQQQQYGGSGGGGQRR